MKNDEIRIQDREIAKHAQVFVVAEIGINHDGKLEQAIKLVDAAVECGADAVKFQTYRADQLLIPSRDRYAQQGGDPESAYELFRRLELPWEAYARLKEHADKRGIIFFSTPFDLESAEFLDSLDVPAFKIASSDLTHHPLLSHVASKGKPILLSTGMSYMQEVADAIWTLKSGGANEIVLLHCVSSYPAPPESLNLRAIVSMEEQFDLLVGYSDHTEGITLPLAAVAMGAVVLEKHFTLNKNASGPDHKLSMDPAELRMLVYNLRRLESALGDGRKRPAVAEEENRRLSRRSIVAAVDIRAHETLELWMLAYKRPGTGIEPREARRLVGSRVQRNILKDQILRWEDLSIPKPDAEFVSLPFMREGEKLHQDSNANEAGEFHG